MSYLRLLIYEDLLGTPDPVSPQEIYRRLLKRERRIGLTSIYRSLDLFETLGIAFKVVMGTQVKYKLCTLEDHHHHVICNRCGNVAEVKLCDMPKWAKKVMASTGYEITDRELSFQGLCGPCREKT